MARRLATVTRTDLVSTLSQLRGDSKALELTVYGANNRILATTSTDADSAVPSYPSDEVLFQLRQAGIRLPRLPARGWLAAG